MRWRQVHGHSVKTNSVKCRPSKLKEVVELTSSLQFTSFFPENKWEKNKEKNAGNTMTFTDSLDSFTDQMAFDYTDT